MISYEFYVKHIEEYFNLVYDVYSTFAPPVLVVYYQNLDVLYDTTSNAGYLNQALPLSPNRYRKIIGVPIVLSDLQAHTTQKDASGYIESTNPFTFVMFGKVGLKPKPDDHISFSLLSNRINSNSLCIIQNVEPAMLLTSSPYLDNYQAFKVTAQIVAPTTINIESKVVEEAVYIDRWNKFLSSSNALLYVNTYSLLKKLENYFQEITNNVTLCLTHLSHSHYNATFCFHNLITENSLSYSKDALSLSTIKNYTLSNTVFEAVLLNKLPYIENFDLVENVIERDVKNQSSNFFNRIYKRFVYVGSPNGPINFYNLFYPNDPTIAQNIIQQMLQQNIDNIYTPINSTHSLANIFNQYVQWKNVNNVVWNESWTNMFEALLLYKYASEVLWMLKML